MALQDLKKPAFAKKRKRNTLTTEEFIEQASLYALGLPSNRASNSDNVIDFITGKPTFTMLGRQSNTKNIAKKGTKKQIRKLVFKNATFSLSYEAIAQLNKLAADTKLAKSRILRILINESQSDPQKLRKKLKETNIK